MLGADADWADRRHFYNVVAQATRQILVDAARRRLRDKRGGGAVPLSLSAADGVACEEDATLLRLHEALEALARQDGRRAQALELTYFAGLDREQVARALCVSVPTVDRDLRFGRAWLKQALESE
jgi:RNA polymerase sigma factor (TIGR02999 family)